MQLPQTKWIEKCNSEKSNTNVKTFPEIINKDSEFLKIIADGYRFGVYQDRLLIISKWFEEQEKAS